MVHDNGAQTASWYVTGTGAEQVQIKNLTDYDENGRATGTSQEITEGVSEPRTLWSTETAYNELGQVESATDRHGNETPGNETLTRYDCQRAVKTSQSGADQNQPL